MAQPPYGQPQSPEYPRRPRRYEESPPYGQQDSYGQQQSYEQQQSYGQPSFEPRDSYGQSQGQGYPQSYGQTQQYPRSGNYENYDGQYGGGQYGSPGDQYGNPAGQYGNSGGGQYGGGQYTGPGGQYGRPGDQYGGPGGQYGDPGSQYAASGNQYPPFPSEKQGNGFAVAGIILAILAWPLGLIFAIIGLVKSGARAGAGKALSITAIVIALVIGGASIAGIIALSKSTVADPGCISAESSARSISSTMDADDKAMTADQNNQSALKGDLQKFAQHSQTFITQLDAAQAKATHPTVKDKIGKMSGDLNGMLTALKAVENGNTSQVNTLNSYADRLQGDGDAIDQICVPFGG